MAAAVPIMTFIVWLGSVYECWRKTKNTAAMASRGTVQTEQQSKSMSGKQLLRIIRCADITDGTAE